ncbi:MAG: YgfZ/GcvT domain-containing protein [Vicinamibacterales bacterium]
MIPAVSPAAYEAARRRVAFLDRSHRGRVVVSGTERASYLQGLLTNDIVALKAGHGCYSAYLTAQGRMITDLYVFELGDVMLLTTSGAVKDGVMARLDQFIFSEDVQLGDVSESFAQIAVVGPGAAACVASMVSGVSEERLRAMSEHDNARGAWTEGAAIVVRVMDTGEPGFDLLVERDRASALKTSLAAAGAVELDAASAEILRIESGVPLFGRDMDEDTIPLEAGIESRAISFTKGCYVGQEVIIRVLHRGHGRVVRKLVGMTFGGEQPPAPGSIVRGGDRDIGYITSAALSPALKRPIALGYVHRDFLEPATTVTVGDEQGNVVALPFVQQA